MFNSEAHHRQMREAGAYRGTRMAILLHGEADENGRWSPPSMMHLRRVLAGPTEEKCSIVDVEVCIRQLKSQGVITYSSEWRSLQLTGGDSE